jgi:LacI family transcriptional regulator
MTDPSSRPPGRREHGDTPTIRHVAEAAGVSIGTVSKALNGQGRLSDDTRERIMRVAREIGYRPNNLAQSLHRSRSMTVGIISNDSFGRFTLPIVEALEEQLADLGIAIFMCNATDDPARERQHLEQLLGKRIDGLVVTARRADMRPPIGPLPGGLPVLYVYSQADSPNTLSLVPDDEGGARLATSHLVTLGRKRIAHITGPERFEAVRLRHRGFLAALATAGLPLASGHYLSGEWSEAWGRDAVARLFDGVATPPDALFCGNDQIGRGALEALRDRRIDVPGQVAVVGFDNWEVMAEAARPPLSSIDMNLETLGREAGRLLIEMIGGAEIHGVRRLPCTLVERQSSAARPPSGSEQG